MNFLVKTKYLDFQWLHDMGRLIKRAATVKQVDLKENQHRQLLNCFEDSFWDNFRHIFGDKDWKTLTLRLSSLLTATDRSPLWKQKLRKLLKKFLSRIFHLLCLDLLCFVFHLVSVLCFIWSVFWQPAKRRLEVSQSRLPSSSCPPFAQPALHHHKYLDLDCDADFRGS